MKLSILKESETLYYKASRVRKNWVLILCVLLSKLPVMQETPLQSLGWEDPLEKGNVTHSSTLAWRIPWTV